MKVGTSKVIKGLRWIRDAKNHWTMPIGDEWDITLWQDERWADKPYVLSLMLTPCGDPTRSVREHIIVANSHKKALRQAHCDAISLMMDVMNDEWHHTQISRSPLFGGE